MNTQNKGLHFLLTECCLFVCLFLFDLILYVTSTISQLNRDWSSWVEPVLYGMFYKDLIQGKCSKISNLIDWQKDLAKQCRPRSDCF